MVYLFILKIRFLMEVLLLKISTRQYVSIVSEKENTDDEARMF